MPYRYVPLLCILALAAAFIIDLLTPQLFVAAILLDVPIVLSSLGGSRPFRLGLLLAALTANVVAGYVNGVQDHHHWDAIGIGDRILSAFSIVLVGYLSSAVADAAQRAGVAGAHERRARREVQIGAAVERVRASLSTELVMRAIAHEALALFDARQARLVVTLTPPLTLVADPDGALVDVDETRLPPEGSSLVQRTLDDGDVALVHRSDALARLVLDTFAVERLLAIPLADGDRRFGVLLVLEPAGETDDVRTVARAYALQAANALAQARLFEQLAERNDALEERNAVIRDLVYALSHDLRTPLAALGMTMRQARDGAFGPLPQAYREIVERSIVATDDVQRLAETLLLVARFESGDRRPEREPVDLADLAAQIGGEMTAMASERGVTLAVRSDGPARVIGDRGDLRRAIVNLVANAVDHTPSGGTVELAVTHADGCVEVRVVDDGAGVSEKARTHLFTRFARGDDRSGGGSGLGLYIAKRVAEESHGTIVYAPNAPRGSTFTLALPEARR